MIRADYDIDARQAFLAIMIVVVGVLSSVVIFLNRHRASSLLCLALTMAATYSLAWGAVGPNGGLDVRVTRMVEQLRLHDINPGDRLIWLSGRSDARLAYYFGIWTERLFSATELAPGRKGRQSVSNELIDRTVAEVKRVLEEDGQAYFVVEGSYWDGLVDHQEIGARLLFRIGNDRGEKRPNDWVVFTGSSGSN